MTRLFCFWIAIGLVQVSNALCQSPLTLIDSQQKRGGWDFDNGQEFPGAVGKLALAVDADTPTLELHGDFSHGGMYVQASRKLPDVPLEAITFEIKVPSGVGKVTTRLIDGTGQCHQLDVRLNDKGGWQRYTFPVARYFDSLAAGSPMDIVTRYEKWGGADDGRWHQPAKLLVFLAGKEAMSEGSIQIRDVLAVPLPPKIDIENVIRLDEFNNHESERDLAGWEFNQGLEFPGAQGNLSLRSLEAVKVLDHRASQAAAISLVLSADFTDGGRYVGARRHLTTTGVKQTPSIHLRARTLNVTEISLRLVDGSDQTHQRHGLRIEADGKWHDMMIEPEKIAGGEHWGGADDSAWHGAAKLIEIMLNERSSLSPSMELELCDISANSVVEATESVESYRESFQSPASVDVESAWHFSGDSCETATTDDANHALRLNRELKNLPVATIATGPSFPVSRGVWKFQYRYRSKLHSPDNSYHGRVGLELHNQSGKVIESIDLGIGYGEQDWTIVETTRKLPDDVASAAFRVDLQKTYGEFWVDDFSATRLLTQPIDQAIERIEITSNAVGNLFLPEAIASNGIQFQIITTTSKPLAARDRSFSYSVRDYRGQVMLQGESQFSNASPSDSQRKYHGTVRLAADQVRIGQFYELHIEIPQGDALPVTEFAGFAVLPEAAAKSFAPEQIPFTIRNWDSRIPDYFYLADRLGLRMLGVWGGWSNEPPYRPELPALEVCEKLGARWITGTPAATIERNGWQGITEESLSQGMTNFLKAYAHRGLAKIALGNEPHGTGDKVKENVRAYKILYDAVKAFDSKIEVIGTSVEPNEAYFEAGYQHSLDSYDFHIYEHYNEVRRTMKQYRELMAKYDAVKPIHSTELGLNSQGQSRLTVAMELIKKCTVFFAEGGQTVSWFTIQYPDPQGTARGQFGDAHCVFDCKFNHYNPRLDAIAYYHLINAMTDKRFVKEEQDEHGTQRFWFANGRGETLQILWNDQAETKIRVALPARGKCEVIRLDGATETLPTSAKAPELNVSAEPLMLLYKSE